MTQRHVVLPCATRILDQDRASSGDIRYHIINPY